MTEAGGIPKHQVECFRKNILKGRSRSASSLATAGSLKVAENGFEINVRLDCSTPARLYPLALQISLQTSIVIVVLVWENELKGRFELSRKQPAELLVSMSVPIEREAIAHPCRLDPSNTSCTAGWQ